VDVVPLGFFLSTIYLFWRDKYFLVLNMG